MSQVADVTVKVNADTSPMTSEIESSSGKLGKLGTLLKGAFAVAAIKECAEAVYEFGKQCVEAYSNFEQLSGGVETLYGSSADAIQQYAQEAYKTAGMSQNEFLELAVANGAKLRASLQGDEQAMAEYTNKLAVQQADIVNKLGVDMESVQNAYAGFAKENYTMLDNLALGYAGTKEGMESLLADAEAISGVHYDISSYADVIDAIGVVTENLGIAGTTALEAQTTIEGSFNMMKSSWENLKLAIATGDSDVISATLENMIESITAVVKNLSPVIASLISGLWTGITTALKNLLTKVKNYLISVLEGDADESGTKFLKSLARAILKGSATVIATIGELVVLMAQALILLVAIGLQKGAEFIKSLGSGIKANVSGVVAHIKLLVSNIVSSFSGLPSRLYTIGVNIITGFWNGLKAKFNAVKSWVASNIGGLGNMVSSLLGIHSPSKVFEAIGKYTIQGFTKGLESEGKVMDAKVKRLFNNMIGWVSGRVTELQSEIDAYNDKIAKAEKQQAFDDLYQNYLDDQYDYETYLSKLADLKEKYLMEDKQAQLDAYEEDLNNLQDYLDEKAEAYEDLQDNISDKASELVQSTGDLFSRSDSGKIQITKISDLKKKLTNYNKALSTMDNLGITGALRDEILSMDTDDMIDFVNALKKKGDRYVANYIDQYESLQSQAKSVATRLYSDDANALMSQWNETAQELVDNMRMFNEGYISDDGGWKDAVVQALTEQKEITVALEFDNTDLGKLLTQSINSYTARIGGE